MTPCRVRVVRRLSFAFAVVLLSLPFGTSRAACPQGQSNPITSGSGKGHPAVVFSNLGGGPTASFFALGAAGLANSGTLPASSWLVNLGDLNGDGLPEYRIEAPGDGDGGWGDPRTVGCPSTLSPARPPLVIQILHDLEDRDGDGAFDVFEDNNHNTLLDQGEDRDGDGRLTPRDGCEGVMREDVDCDGHLDFFWEDVNHNHVLDFGEDRDGDHKLDYIDEDLNHNGVLDPGEDRNHNGILDTFDPSDPFWDTHPHPYIEDRNGDQILNDRPFVRPDDVIYEYKLGPNGVLLPPVQISPTYPYGSFFPAPGAIVTALVTWNGVAYDLSDMPTSTRLSATTQSLAKGNPKP